MALLPLIAKLVPQKVRDFCEGMRNPNAFIAAVPAFFVVLLFAHYIPFARELALVLALTIVFSSRRP